MPSTYTPRLRLTLPATGELINTWGGTVNTGITELVDVSIAGSATLSTWGGAGVAYTLSNNNGVADEARSMFLLATGSPGENKNIICPAVTKLYVVRNSVSGGYSVTLKTAAGTGITVSNGNTQVLWCDGTNVVEATTEMTSAYVTFLQAGSGAVTRTVQSKLRDTVSVKDFGAVGDGVADDLTAINLALASGAKSVYFPAGTYRVSDQVFMNANGVNAWSDARATIKPIDGLASGFGIIRVRGSNTTIDGLIIEGNTANPPLSGNHSAISLDTNSGTLTNVDIVNCTVQDFKGYGVYAFSAGTLTDVNILNCAFFNFTSTAPTPPGAIQLVNPTSSDIRVVDCYFKDLNSAGVAVRSVAGTAPVTNMAIVGCVFEHNTSLYTTIGAEVWDARNLSVSGCTFKNARMGLSIFGENIAIAGNTFDNETSYCIEAGPSIGLSVSGNSFSNFEYGLIHYNGARDVVIDGNTFRDALAGSTSALNLGWGVQQSGAGGATNYEQFIISNNVFKNCSGVRLLEPNTNVVEGNVFETTSSDNICKLLAPDDASKRCVFTNNVFRTAVNVGISSAGLLQFGGSDHLIANNSFIATTGSVAVGSGIANAPGAVIDNVVITNTYANNFTNGIILNSGTPTASNIEVSSTEAVNCTVAVQSGVGTENFFGPAKSGLASIGDTDTTITGRTAKIVHYSTTLTANRTITLDSTDVTQGSEYIVFRQGAGDFTLDVGGLVTLNRFESCTIFWQTAGWRLKSYYPQSFRTVYQNSRSAAYTLVLSDSGKQILHPASDNNPRTFTIPANSSVLYPIGTELTFINMINTLTIAITSDTLIQAGTGSTGSRTLAANGWARALKISATEWLIDGTGLT